ncbi:hypothetical protein AGMMS49942_13240 [Spirochaetia bacterium]|nr:hypothetical protein AGMMS49942_13240 [Spirochaetia bacterium]
MNNNPFEPEVFRLRVPIKKGEVEYKELTLKPPVLRDVLRTDGHDPASIGYARALLSALSGAPEAVLDQLVPEDWADLRIILARTNMRFMGLVNLLDKKPETEEDKSKDPTEAAENIPPQNSGPTSAA